ncbi:hypothetical protein EJ110_NYTH11360 [Nymphaea thermarum]|nr:hypothetical protein EJ110_NYTH11360 [Nymphaea thermarum]
MGGCCSGEEATDGSLVTLGGWRWVARSRPTTTESPAIALRWPSPLLAVAFPLPLSCFLQWLQCPTQGSHRGRVLPGRPEAGCRLTAVSRPPKRRNPASLFLMRRLQMAATEVRWLPFGAGGFPCSTPRVLVTNLLAAVFDHCRKKEEQGREEKQKRRTKRSIMSDPKYAYPYPAQGYYQGPPVMAPPQYQYAAPPPQRNVGFLEGCLAALCCCCLIDECCCDPSVICLW